MCAKFSSTCKIIFIFSCILSSVSWDNFLWMTLYLLWFLSMKRSCNNCKTDVMCIHAFAPSHFIRVLRGWQGLSEAGKASQRLAKASQRLAKASQRLAQASLGLAQAQAYQNLAQACQSLAQACQRLAQACQSLA